MTLYTWELPQSLLGLALLCWLQARGGVRGIERRPDGRSLVETDSLSVSLGAVVFWGRAGRGPVEQALVRAHELGHTGQSRRLGPLYLFTVGVASPARVAYAWWHRRRTGRGWSGYFDGWPEDEADRLGGIVRDAHGGRALRTTPRAGSRGAVGPTDD